MIERPTYTVPVLVVHYINGLPDILIRDGGIFFVTELYPNGRFKVNGKDSYSTKGSRAVPHHELGNFLERAKREKIPGIIIGFGSGSTRIFREINPAKISKIESKLKKLTE